MKQDHDQPKATEVDPQVSDHYESIAKEETPVHLDQAVLREAKRAVRADNRKGSFGAWFRPVAFVTTVGLSLAIILDLSDSGIFKPVADPSFDTAPTVQAPPKSTDNGAGRNPGQAALSEIKRQEKLAPAQSLTVDTPDNRRDNAAIATPRAAASESPQPEQGQLQKMRSEIRPANTPPPAAPLEDQDRISDALAAEAANAELRVQEVERNLDTYKQAQPATKTQLNDPQADIATAAFAMVPSSACSNEQKSEVEDWWKCIESLRQSGLAELADLEFENLRQIFPDFEPPM
jgi:hypothetical protein